MNIAWLGLGIMGSRMAHNLLKSGMALTVWNRSEGPVGPLLEAGAQCASTPKEAVKQADVVISMLANPQVVETVMLGESGTLKQMKAGAIWMDCSTVNPSFSLVSAKAATQAKVRFLDAPVAGTKPHAANAQLSFFVGGAAPDLAEVRPLLEIMGQKVLHIGPQGKGSAFKMLVNALLAQSMLAFSETVLLGEKLGLDREFLLNTLPNLVVSAPFTKAKADMIRTENYAVQFPLELMHKDLQLVAQTAYELDQPLYLANLTKELYSSAKAAGMGRLDFAAIHAFLEATPPRQS